MKKVIAADLGGTKLTVAVFDEELNIENQKTVQVSDKDYPSTVELLINLLNEYEDQGVDAGISIAGLIDADGNIMQRHGDKWEKYPLLRHLNDSLKIPFVIENDGSAAALAEWKFGEGKGFDELVVITLGTKVGSGIIHNGELFQWHPYLPPQIGGILQTPDGVTSATFAGRLAGGYGLKSITSRLFGREIDGPELAEMARSANGQAQAAFDELGKWIGLTVANAINLFNPKRVILNGGLTLAFDLWEKEMATTTRNHLLPYPSETQIVKGRFINDASLYGAAVKAIALQPR